MLSRCTSCNIQVITTSENERRLWISVKSSRFLVYNVAPSERAHKASKQSFTNGARSPAGRKRVEILLRPFEKVGRVVTPGHNHWKEAGGILAKVLHDRPDLKGKLPAL